MNVAVQEAEDCLAVRPSAGHLSTAAPLRVLTMTTLFPSTANPRHGIFVETRIRKLCESFPVDIRVVAPVPWFPVRWPIAGRYATYATTPRQEEHHGINVRHPRYLSIPRVGMTMQPVVLASAALRATRELLSGGWSCDVIDAHYLYPDGVAAAALARKLERPFVVTARGSDVNLIAQMPGPRRRILKAMEGAGRIIAVSEALKAELVRLGIPGSKVEVLRNGVDARLFEPGSREETRKRLGMGRAPLILTVGNLVEEKGLDLVLRSARLVDDARLVIVGEGPERARLAALADELGTRHRVQFIGNLPQSSLASMYAAADVLALGSTREGWPNVLLEAIACGTPVVATAVGGVREIVSADIAGEVVSERNELEFASALKRVLARPAERAAVRSHALAFSWEPIVRRYHEILTSVARG